MLFPRDPGARSFDVIGAFRCVAGGSFTLASLILTRRDLVTPFTITFTTAAFDRSSLWRFEAFPYRAAPKGLPSSLTQHGACAPSWLNQGKTSLRSLARASFVTEVAGQSPATIDAKRRDLARF